MDADELGELVSLDPGLERLGLDSGKEAVAWLHRSTGCIYKLFDLGPEGDLGHRLGFEINEEADCRVIGASNVNLILSANFCWSPRSPDTNGLRCNQQSSQLSCSLFHQGYKMPQSLSPILLFSKSNCPPSSLPFIPTE